MIGLVNARFRFDVGRGGQVRRHTIHVQMSPQLSGKATEVVANDVIEVELNLETWIED